MYCIHQVIVRNRAEFRTLLIPILHGLFLNETLFSITALSGCEVAITVGQGCARDLLRRDRDETRDSYLRDRDVQNFVQDETETRRCSFRDGGLKLPRLSRDAMARDPRRDLLSRDQDILLRDRDETLVRLETVSRPRMTSAYSQVMKILKFKR